MRSFSHWTPAYIYHRLADWFYRLAHPKDPWLTPKAVNFLSAELKRDFVGLEYGSGRSTTWFATRIKKLISVEHNSEWFARVNSEIKSLGLTNVEYHHFSRPEGNLPYSDVIKSDYVLASGEISEQSLDFALVDGIVRPACVCHTIPLLKNGAFLIIDDANHYLPCDSQAPNTRTFKDGPLNEEWILVQKELEGWESNWFGNGIKETVVFKKPKK